MRKVVIYKRRLLLAALPLVAGLACLLLTSLAAPALAQEEDFTPEDYRRLFKDMVKAENIVGPAIGGLVNAAISPDISAAHYEVDGPDDFSFQTLKVPIQYEFRIPNQEWRPRLGLHLGYLGGESEGLAVMGDQPEDLVSMDVDWTGYSGLLEGGAVFPIAWGLELCGDLGIGLAQIRNNTTYGNQPQRDMAAYYIDGILANFYVTTLIYNASLGATWRGGLGAVDIEAALSYDHTWIESIDYTDDTQDFDAQADTVLSRLTFSGPLGVSLASNPLGWQVIMAHTAFLGPDGDVLGFNRFFELGGAVKMDISRMGMVVRELRLGGTVITGPDVSGWSILFGYDF